MSSFLKWLFATGLCACLAAWIRLAEPSLFLRSWAELVHAPVRELLGALLAAPLFELLALFPAYVLASALYLLAIVLFNQKPRLFFSILLGSLVALLVFTSLAFITQMWVMRGVSYTLKLQIMYTAIGALFGALGHRFGLDDPPRIKGLV
jgi:hypothetical protein